MHRNIVKFILDNYITFFSEMVTVFREIQLIVILIQHDTAGSNQHFIDFSMERWAHEDFEACLIFNFFLKTWFLIVLRLKIVSLFHRLCLCVSGSLAFVGI